MTLTKAIAYFLGQDPLLALHLKNDAGVPRIYGNDLPDVLEFPYVLLERTGESSVRNSKNRVVRTSYTITIYGEAAELVEDLAAKIVRRFRTRSGSWVDARPGSLSTESETTRTTASSKIYSVPLVYEFVHSGVGA